MACVGCGSVLPEPRAVLTAVPASFASAYLADAQHSNAVLADMRTDCLMRQSHRVIDSDVDSAMAMTMHLIGH